MNIIDAVIIVILIVGFLKGFKDGTVKTVVKLIGLVLVIVGAYYLKNPISMFCYNNFPFLNFKIFSGVSVVNILFYEFIGFIIASAILSVLLRIVLGITGIIERVFNATIVLGAISKLIGGVLGAIEFYIIMFIVLFFFKQPFMEISGVNDSKYADMILTKTPYLTDAVGSSIKVVDELYDMKDNYKLKGDEFEYQALDKFIEYKIIELDAVKTLKDKKKLDFDGLNELIEKYGG